MLTVPGSAPLGSVMWVWLRPRETAVWLILVTKADVDPASQSARSVAMSLPESMSSPCSAFSSVRISQRPP